MATLLPSGEQQFLDGDGAPLVGGEVFHYVPGTTSYKDTWQDPAGTILNHNPVILDTAGRATIYGVGAYRQLVKDAAGDIVTDATTADTSSSGASWAGTSTGTGTNIVLAAPSFGSLDGQAVDFLLGVTLTGAAQVTVNGVAIPLKLDTLSGPVQTAAGSAVAGTRCRVTYDATMGLFHLTPLVDRGYVDAGAAAGQSYAAAQGTAALDAAKAYSDAGNASTLSSAQSYAQSQAVSALTQAEAYATSQATATANSAVTQSTGYTDRSVATASANANSYAASQAASALSQAQTYAQGQAATALAQANANANAQASSALSQANSYTNGQITALSNTAAQTYARGVRLSGAYTAALAGRVAGSVCIGTGGGSQSNYALLQYNSNGQWMTVADA